MVRLLTPEAALGCRADLVILTHLDVNSWDLRAPSVPGLTEQERAELGVLPPDAPLRSARHAWNHLLQCAGEVIILDAAEDESPNPPHLSLSGSPTESGSRSNHLNCHHSLGLMKSTELTAERQVDGGYRSSRGKVPFLLPDLAMWFLMETVGSRSL
jgi:hypothetical protein